MATHAEQRTSRLELGSRARELLLRRAHAARRRARTAGEPVLASVTTAVESDLDPCAAVLGGRFAQERVFCFERPDWGGFALAGLGEAATVAGGGSRRFAHAAEGCRRLSRNAVCDEPAADAKAPAGAGPVFVGGLAFQADGGYAPEWQGLGGGSLVVPQISLARARGQARLTVSVCTGAGDDCEQAVAAVVERLRRVFEARIESDVEAPAATPAAGARSAADYEAAVASAVARITAGELSKVVLARQVQVPTPEPRDPAAVFAALRECFPSCYCYLMGVGSTAFVGASPELLVRRDGSRCQTVALAGTTRRSADPAVDAHLGERLLQSSKDRAEQAIVADRIKQRLHPVSLWVTAAADPAIVKVQNVQHLATPIRAQLADPLSALELCGQLHPTPAVGGEPWERAESVLAALEGFDRGWYAGPVGWTDLAEDGEYCVALRCALIEPSLCRLYAGCGIVGDSVPEQELRETEIKLEALLPLVT